MVRRSRACTASCAAPPRSAAPQALRQKRCARSAAHYAVWVFDARPADRVHGHLATSGLALMDEALTRGSFSRDDPVGSGLWPTRLRAS